MKLSTKVRYGMRAMIELAKQDDNRPVPLRELAEKQNISAKYLEQMVSLLKTAGLCPSTSEARRAITQGGAYLGDDKTRIESYDQLITVDDGLLLWVGKKRFCRVELTTE